MRKAQKQEVLDCIVSLRKAHEEIKGAFRRKNTGQAQNMLSQCQEFAVSLGGIIESLEEKEHITAAYLEEYCRLLYYIFEEAQKGQLNESRMEKRLRNQLLKIENSVKHDITAREEVVFFPYKASMWDSLESIYLAAKEDPDCDAYCVPIPYFERNPDGSLGKMHYEGKDYPQNIEVLDWESYCFEERKPDVVYIHNPYDNKNYVTSIHPRFYAENLKKYTKQLVYIPYFILGEVDPDNQEAVDRIKHFIWTPGVIFSDKVIVQSEKMRQVYVNEYQKTAKEYGLLGEHRDRKYLERKILGLGSPKVDKILNMEKEALDMPEKWLKCIQKPDGGRKKLILYNTGVTALLQYNEQWLTKIEQALKSFKENQDKVTLLWRPHPLIESTMKSMRPEILRRYLDLKEDYMKEGWGIYDDCPDLHRAIAWSDAYYGDGSSITALYAAAGKPVMIQNAAASENHRGRRLIFENLFDDGEQFWFTSMNFNSLWTMDKRTCEVKHIGFFPEEKGDKWRQFYSIVKAEDRLFFIPLAADHIAVYSIAAKQFSTISIPQHPDFIERKVKFNSDSKFIDGYVYGSNLYLAPNTYPGILKYNLDTGRTEILDDWIPELDSLIETQYSLGYFSCGIASQNKLLLACIEADALLEFDMADESYLIHKINSKNVGYQGICFDGKNYWLSPVRGGEVVKWERSAGMLTKLDVLTGDEETLLFPFIDISFCGGYIWLLPLNGSRAIRISPDTNQAAAAPEFRTEIELPQLNKGIDSRMCFFLQKSDCEILYAYSVKSCSLLAYDLKNYELKKQPVAVNTDEFERVCAGFMEKYAVQTEGSACFYEGASEPATLEAYLRLVIKSVGSHTAKKEKNGAAGMTGSNIYAYMKNEVLLS